MLEIKFILILTLTILLNYLSMNYGYRILGIFPLNMRSHMMMFEQMMKGLARRGHQVDVVNTLPLKKSYPNYTDIVIPPAWAQVVNNVSYDYLPQMKQAIDTIAVLGGNNFCEKGLVSSEINNLIINSPKNPPYDLVMTEIFSANCFIAFGHHLKVPVIGLTSFPLYPWTNDFIANPENLAFVPNILLDYNNNMNYWDRLYNVIYTIYSKLSFYYYTSVQSELVKNSFGDDIPDIRELERDLAIILSNSHFSLNGIKPTTPALIEVGGLHIQDNDIELPLDHKKWLDESRDGFIYFTFGSMLKIESFPKHILENIYKSFEKLAPIRVFMKAPQPQQLPPGLPNNVRTFVWISQLKVLKHKNIRAFITHGGLMSTQEAIYCAVPMIGIPLFGDQFLNIDRYVNKKIAIRLDHETLTEAELDVALNEILFNPIYKKSVEEVSKKFLDRPLSPLDEACYWVEYIIRHGKNALRSPALSYSWWQIALLDVYLTLFIVGNIILLVLIIVILTLINITRKNLSYVTNSKKKN